MSDTTTAARDENAADPRKGWRAGMRFRTLEGQTGTIVYMFAVPSDAARSMGYPVTVKFDHSRGTFVIAADRLIDYLEAS